MSDSPATALICSDRTEVSESLVRELGPLGASCHVASARAEWPVEAPGIAFIDLADAGQPVRQVRLAYGPRTDLVAVVDNESVERLIPALAAIQPTGDGEMVA